MKKGTENKSGVKNSAGEENSSPPTFPIVGIGASAGGLDAFKRFLAELLQSSNEELQAANEELETSREELQSLNEELITVNSQLQAKIEEQDELNNDLNNFLVSTSIPTVFLDDQFRVKRFTPAMAKLLKLIPSDVGRPIIDMSQEGLGPDLIADAESVLEHLSPIKKEIAINGSWYIRATLPYRTSDNRIEGVIITYSDITELKRAEEHTKHLASFPELNPNPVIETDSSGKIIFANPASQKILESLGMDKGDISAFLPADFGSILVGLEKSSESTLDREITIKDKVFGETVFLSPQFNVVRIYAYEITGRKKAEEALRAAHDELELRVKQRTGELMKVNEELETEIAERRRAEIIAKTERQRLYDVLETLPVYVVLLSPDYHVPFANRFFRERFGESHGKRCFEYLFGRDEPCEICDTYKVLNTNAPNHSEWTGPDSRNYDIYDFPFKDSDGSPLIMEMGIDITEQKQAEKALKEINETLELRVAERTAELAASETRLSRAQEIAHLGSWELDLLKNKLTWTDEVYRIFGLQPQEFGATYGAFLERVHPEDRVAVDAAYSDSLREGKDSYEIEHRVMRKDNGEVLWIHEKCQHIRDDAGIIIRSVGMVLDITERKRSQEALRESEQRVRLKLESVLSPEGDIGRLELADLIDSQALQSLMDEFYKVAHIPVSILDSNGKVLVGAGWQEICTKFHRVNHKTCQYCLESDTELSSELQAGEFRLYKCKNNMWDIATPIIVVGKRLGGIFSGQFFFDDETPDREQFRAQARIYGFDEEEYLAALDKVPRLSRQTVDRGMAFFVKLADMLSKLGYSNVKLARLLTERDHLTEDLKRSNSDLEQFAYIASHDLQSPLRNVEGFVQLLARRYKGQLDGKADEFIQYISTGVKDMQMLILDILEYSKVGSGSAAFSEMDISLCISKALANLKDAVAEKNADIVLEEPFPAVSGDSVQITSLFQNLIGNAIKFCKGIPKIHISAKKEGPEYTFSVRDNGIGIYPENSDKIFAVFHRLHGKTEYPGTGIGLALCKKIVERHGGRIWVESEPGEGSTFFFSLPSKE